MPKIAFSKYCGAGNDFIICDNRLRSFPLSPSLIQKICDRKRGVGADGLLLLEKSLLSPYKMRIFNSDGSEASMCGNGLRCFTKWLQQIGETGPHYLIEVGGSLLETTIESEYISTQIPTPQEIKRHTLHLLDRDWNVVYLHTGVPHAVLFAEDITHLNVSEIGPLIRHHSLWGKEGTNVTFAQKIAPKNIETRTFERGVEEETLSCGTGAVAAALVHALETQETSPIIVRTKSQESLAVSFSPPPHFTTIALKGTAQFICEGSWAPPSAQ